MGLPSEPIPPGAGRRPRARRGAVSGRAMSGLGCFGIGFRIGPDWQARGPEGKGRGLVRGHYPDGPSPRGPFTTPVAPDIGGE